MFQLHGVISCSFSFSTIVQSKLWTEVWKPVANIIVMLDNASKSSMCFNAWCILQTVYHFKKDDGERNPDIEQIALHEAAHVVMADVLKPDSVSLVTLRRNGYTQGMTQYYCDQEISTEADFLNLAIKSLAGKAGVEMVYTRFDMGTAEDIQTAVGYVRQWIESFGGSGFSGVTYDHRTSSETLLAQNEAISAAKLEELYRTAQTILRDNLDFLLAVQKALLEQETLFGSDVAAIRKNTVTQP